jgi:hypothetical protein
MKNVEKDRESETRSVVSSILRRTRYSPDPVIGSKRRRRRRGGRLFPRGTRDATGFLQAGAISFRIDVSYMARWPDGTSWQRSHVPAAITRPAQLGSTSPVRVRSAHFLFFLLFFLQKRTQLVQNCLYMYRCIYICDFLQKIKVGQMPYLAQRGAPPLTLSIPKNASQLYLDIRVYGHLLATDSSISRKMLRSFF